MYERGLEHARDRKNKKEEGHIHAESEHEGKEEVEFRMKVVRHFKSAMMRQLSEAVTIKRNAARFNILNLSKNKLEQTAAANTTQQKGDLISNFQNSDPKRLSMKVKTDQKNLPTKRS